MGYMFYIWLVIMIIAVLIEIVTTDLTSIWFAAGSLISLIASIFMKNEFIYLQVCMFAVVSILAIFLLKPIIKKKFNNDKTATNVHALVGKTVKVVSTISLNNPGSVKAEGIEWTANTNMDKFEVGDLVEIVSVTGNTLLVKRKEEK